MEQDNGKDDPQLDFEAFSDEQWVYIGKHFHLSPRQLRVAKLVCEGETNEDIAKELDRSVSTVRQHIKTIFAKTRSISKVWVFLRFRTAIEAVENRSEQSKH